MFCEFSNRFWQETSGEGGTVFLHLVKHFSFSHKNNDLLYEFIAYTVGTSV